jgi:hypothetical protein
MQTYPSSAFVYRLFAKVSSLVSTVWTMLFYPRKFRTADIHLLLQSTAQKAAQKTLHRIPASAKGQRVLVVMPFRDKWKMTQISLDSLRTQLLGPHEVLVALVDNGSVEKDTQVGIESCLRSAEPQLHFRHLRYDVPFNFSALNNWAVRDCADFQADILFLCNNDIEFLDPHSLQKLVEFTRDQEKAGAVGCTLIYPNRKIQHLFVYVGSKIVGAHPHKGRSLNLNDAWFAEPRPVGAVTGAITAMRTAIFLAVGGFDEKLPTSYQDVDLCLKFQSMGLVNWVVPDVVMIHHETQSRSREPSWDEAYYVYRKWGDFIKNNPYVHAGLNRHSEHYVLRTLKST